MIISGWLLLLIELTPRMVMDDEAPGTPELLVTSTPATRPCKRVDEVFAACLRDIGAEHRLLRRADRSLHCRLTQRRHDHCIEARGCLLELDIDDVCGADHALTRDVANDAEDQYLTDVHIDRVVTGRIGLRRLAGPLDDHRHAGKGNGGVSCHFAGDGLLLRTCVRRHEKRTEQQREYSLLHHEGCRVVGGCGGGILRTRSRTLP